MRRARLLVTPQVFVELLKGAAPRTFDIASYALPDDTRVVDVLYIHSSGQIELLLESETFHEVPEKAQAPLIEAPQVRLVAPPVPAVPAESDAQPF